MNILYIWDADYPWDVRVEKICRTLMEGGHTVHIAARNLKKRPIYEDIDGLRVHRINTWRSDALNYFLTFPLFCSPVWRRFLDSIIRENAIQLIIVRDLPMAIAGISAGRRAGIPVVFDMAEDYVSLVRDIWDDRKFHGFNLVVRNPYLARLVERYTFRHIDEILVVVEEAKGVVVAGGGDKGKVTLVGNTPDISRMGTKRQELLSGNLQEIADHYSVIYTGGIQLGRGLQVVFDAIPAIVKQVPDFRFVVVGDGYATSALKALMREKGVEEYVLWVGWIPHAELGRYIEACRVGIIPHYTSNHVNTTIPNKIFDYMGCGLPVLASDATPMKRVIEEERCGRTFPSGDAAALARELVSMRGQEGALGENGRRAVMDRYNWNADAKRLLELVGRLN